MTTTPALDHIALSVPNLDEHVARLATAFGIVVELHFEGGMAVLADPASGLKLELSASQDSDVHFRHFGFRSDDVDRAHATLVEAGMESNELPQRQDFARMYQFAPTPAGRRRDPARQVRRVMSPSRASRRRAGSLAVSASATRSSWGSGRCSTSDEGRRCLLSQVSPECPVRKQP